MRRRGRARPAFCRACASVLGSSPWDTSRRAVRHRQRFGSAIVRVRSRAGGTRTPNRRFWRPVLYQLSHCPRSCHVHDGAEDRRTPRQAPRHPRGQVRPAAHPAAIRRAVAVSTGRATGPGRDHRRTRRARRRGGGQARQVRGPYAAGRWRAPSAYPRASSRSASTSASTAGGRFRTSARSDAHGRRQPAVLRQLGLAAQAPPRRGVGSERGRARRARRTRRRPAGSATRSHRTGWAPRRRRRAGTASLAERCGGPGGGAPWRRSRRCPAPRRWPRGAGRRRRAAPPRPAARAGAVAARPSSRSRRLRGSARQLGVVARA